MKTNQAKAHLTKKVDMRQQQTSSTSIQTNDAPLILMLSSSLWQDCRQWASHSLRSALSITAQTLRKFMTIQNKHEKNRSQRNSDEALVIKNTHAYYQRTYTPILIKSSSDLAPYRRNLK